MSDEKYILYDANCDFCSKTVAYFILKNNNLTAIPVQDVKARYILKDHNIRFVNLNTIYFIENNTVYIKSQAIFYILKHTAFPLKCLSVFTLLPRNITDFIYSWVAKNRHRF